VIQTTKKDWLLSTMMLLPLPVIIGWFMAITPSGKMDEESLEMVNEYAPWIGLCFMMLAFSMGTFIRLRQRWLRVSLLAVSGLLTLTIAVYLATGRFVSASFIGPVLGMWAVLLVPPLLERQLKKGYWLFRKSKSPGEPNEPAAI
jgi:O-antigen/teichoic acid export membrane protein